MSLLRNITSGLRSLFRKESVQRELDEELRGFLDMAAEEKLKEGMNHKDALRAVRLERGNLEVTKEVVRAAGWESFVETCWQDLRFAARMLRKNLGFTSVAVPAVPKAIHSTATQVNPSYFPTLPDAPRQYRQALSTNEAYPETPAR